MAPLPTPARVRPYPAPMVPPRFASALSTHPEHPSAEREAVERLAAGLGGRRPDLVLVFVSHHHGSGFEDLARRLRSATGAAHLLGATGESIIGPEREVEGGPALALWAVSMPGLAVRPFHCVAAQRSEDEIEFSQTPTVARPQEAGLLLLGEPFSFPMAEYLRALEDVCPGLQALGGMASGGNGPGQNFLFLDDEWIEEGAVGAVLEGGIELAPVVSQGCRPVGKPYVVTALTDHLVQKLGGRPAGEVLMETLHQLPAADRTLFQRQPFLGLALDPTKSRFERGDFLVRGIRGLQAEDGAMAVADDSIRRGMTVQFMVRDAASAGEDLEQLLEAQVGGAPPAAPGELGVLLFSCNGRGARMFQEPDHDLGRVRRAFSSEVPVAGFFAMGEIGPVGGRNFLHGFTASAGIFRARRGTDPSAHGRA